MKLSDYVLKFVQSKVNNIFILPGGGCIHLIDSLANIPELNYVCMQHEQTLAMAVEGYSRINGFGVGLVTTGPGGLNAVPGVGGAWLDSIPCLIISGQVPTTQSAVNTGCRQVGDQEINIVDIVKPITKYAITITDPNSIRYHLEKAYWISKEGRPGPVWIDIPLDIQSAQINPEELQGFSVEKFQTIINKQTIDKVIEKLVQAKRPLVVVGSGCKHSKEDLLKFLEVLGLPVMTGCHSGVDIVPSSYPLHMGRFGIFGQIYSNELIQECDFLLVIGSRLPTKLTGYDDKSFATNAYKIIVDIDPFEMNKSNIHADLRIQADAKDFICQLRETTILAIDIDKWRTTCSYAKSKYTTLHSKFVESKTLSSYYFAHKLNELVPNNIPIITSNGMAHLSTMPVIPCERTMFTNVACASMGWGLPAAIGACFAHNKQSIICVEGDGSIHMVIYELQTISHYNLPIKIFVINNAGYGSIRQTQNNLFHRLIASSKNTGMTLPPLQKVVDAYNIQYLNAFTNKESEFAIKNALSIPGPVFCELFVSPDEIFEPRIKTSILGGKFIPATLNTSTYGL